jgi:hypothetical protein
MTTTAPDGPLAVARHRLTDAVSALADPIPVCVGGGVYRWSESLYVQLRQALAGDRLWVRRVFHSRLPCRADVLALVIEIDTAAAGWEPHGKSTVERLRGVVARGRRPQDCELIDVYCDRVARWGVAAAEVLALVPKVFLEVPCPRCAARFAYRRDEVGDRVRMRALRIGEDGCTCLACSAFWPPERFEWLARLLGCPPLPA